MIRQRKDASVISATGASTTTMSGRVLGLDSIRFILAVWVMVGHFGRLPYADRLDGSSLPELAVRGVYNNLISGPAAVIVFFVISGFCIHFPYRASSRVALVPYFARRHVRILTPVVVAVSWAWSLGMRFPVFNHSILWSLVCEEIYYSIYPILLRVRLAFGWKRMIAGSFLASLAVILTNPSAGDYPSYGPGLNWLLGLPCWLLGCDLAERWDGFVQRRPLPGAFAIWRWRFAVLSASVICSALRFHSSLTYPWTLNVFAVLAVIWLEREIVYWRERPPARLLEWGGSFSYSIYLVHMHGVSLFNRVFSARLAGLTGWCIKAVCVLAVCYVFYRIVERPSHRLARSLYEVLSRRWRAEHVSLDSGRATVAAGGLAALEPPAGQ
jgi:peptidoglycan/LPS O-acetylase OafA/YrhL